MKRYLSPHFVYLAGWTGCCITLAVIGTHALTADYCALFLVGLAIFWLEMVEQILRARIEACIQRMKEPEDPH